MEEEFAAARGGNEIDLSGSGRAAFELNEEGKIHDQFLANLEALAKGRVGGENFRITDVRLNTEYKALIAERTKEGPSGTVTVAGIRETQRVWIKLRDQWVQLVKAAFPDVTAEQIETLLTKQRIAQLKNVE